MVFLFANALGLVFDGFLGCIFAEDFLDVDAGAFALVVDALAFGLVILVLLYEPFFFVTV